MSFKSILVNKPDDYEKSLNKFRIISENRSSVEVRSRSRSLTSVSKVEKVDSAPIDKIPTSDRLLLGNDCRCHIGFEGISEDQSVGESLEKDDFGAREDELRAEYEAQIENEITSLKEKFDLILQNEQVRSSCLLREAHRERQEKIAALKTQLECKNLAGLMYVLCAERRKSRLEKMQILEEYTGYIGTLQQTITEGQTIVRDMARGYKTAAVVDAEWRVKTEKIVKEFQMFIEHFLGSQPESSRYFFDLPALLTVCAPLDPDDGVEEMEQSVVSSENASKASAPEEDTWWAKLKTADKPFVVFGDMADFAPPQRRELLKHLKEDKTTPPEKWKEYAFNNKFLKSDCLNLDFIKHEYAKHLPDDRSRCDNSQGVQTNDPLFANLDGGHRLTACSTDIRHGAMGSILKIVTHTPGYPRHVQNKASILGARDSLEIASSTKLLEKEKTKTNLDDINAQSASYSDELSGHGVVMCNRTKKTSIAPDVESRIVDDFYRDDSGQDQIYKEPDCIIENGDNISHQSKLASLHNDSLPLVASRTVDTDKIGYEKECPVEECQRKHVNSFIRSLPPYMRYTSPFKQYDRTFDQYEPCTKEQLDRLTAHPRVAEARAQPDEMSLGFGEAGGVFVQTSLLSVGGVGRPACACHLLPPSARSSGILGPHMQAPLKKKYDHIRQSQLFDENIQFQRFKVLGEETIRNPNPEEDFTKLRANSIIKILKKHPSLCSLFQASARC